jgi:putative ABC transport system permease protein
MWKVTLKNLRARKLRLLLTGIAVTLGVAFMAGTLTLTDTVQRTFDDLFGDIYKNTDAVVRTKSAISSDQFGGDVHEPVSESLLPKVKSAPLVAAAEGNVAVQYAQLVDSKGDAIGNPGSGAPSLGFVWSDNKDLNPFRLEPGGRAPRSDDEIVIDKKSADKGDLKIGDRTRVLSQAPPKVYTIVGIARFGTVDSPAGASVVLFTQREAQRAASLPGKFTDISVVGEPGVSQAQLRQSLRDHLRGEHSIEVITGKQLTKENQDQVKKFLNVFRTELLVFAAVSLLVGIFIIYNTFSIIVAQRTREMALLRAVGASNRQVMLSVLGESIGIGIIASLIGLVAGILLSVGLKALLNVVGFEIPGGSVVVKPATIIVSLVVCVVVTVISALLPARAAARVPPVAAMRDVAIERKTNIARRGVIGLVIGAIGGISMAYGLFGSPSSAISFVGLGALLTFIATFVLAPILARPAAIVIGAPLPSVKGMTGELARENALRNPKRTARTAAALMVGVALVAFITIFAATAKKSFAAAISDEIKVDYIITSGRFGGSGLSPSLGQSVAKLPEVAASTPIRIGPVKVGDSTSIVTAADPKAAASMFDFDFKSGSMGDITDQGIAISKKYADDHNLKVGDSLKVLFPKGQTVPLRVDGIYKRTDIGGTYIISLNNFEKNQSQQFQLDLQIYARLKPGVSVEQGRAAIEPLLKPYPNAKLQDEAQFKADQVSSIDTILNLVYALLFLAILIALIGIANTLALSIHERTREIGLLRAVGMSRPQVRSSIRWESVIISLFGTGLGVAVAFLFSWSVVSALSDQGFNHFSAAPVQIIVIVVLAALAGVVAAIWPARRAAKVDVLRAISSE